MPYHVIRKFCLTSRWTDDVLHETIYLTKKSVVDDIVAGDIAPDSTSTVVSVLQVIPDECSCRDVTDQHRVRGVSLRAGGSRHRQSHKWVP